MKQFDLNFDLVENVFIVSSLHSVLKVDLMGGNVDKQKTTTGSWDIMNAKCALSCFFSSVIIKILYY